MKDNSNFNNWLIGAMIAIVLIFCISLAIILRGAAGPDKSISTLRIEFVENDSISIAGGLLPNNFGIINRNLADSLVNRINRQEDELSRNYNLFMDARKDDADIVKILSCIGGFVLAVCALFGIKSYKDLQNKLLEEAKDTANCKVDDFLQVKIPSAISERISQSLIDRKYKDEVKEEIIKVILEEHIIDIEQRVLELEAATSDHSSSSPDNVITEVSTNISNNDPVRLSISPNSFDTNESNQD